MNTSQKVRAIAEANPTEPRKNIMAMCVGEGIKLTTANSVYAAWKQRQDPLLVASKAFGEENDTAVRTIAKVTDLDYASAHALFKGEGRRNKRRFGITRVFDALKNFSFNPVKADATVGDVTKVCENGTFIVAGTGFEFAVVDGKAETRGIPADKKVTSIFEVQAA